MERSVSSSRPISSKLPTSVKTLSGPSIWEEEWKEEDLEDLDPDNSGGELGVAQTVVVMVACSQLRYTGPPQIPWATGKNRRRMWAEGACWRSHARFESRVSGERGARGDSSGVDRKRNSITSNLDERSEVRARPQPDDGQIRYSCQGKEYQETGFSGERRRPPRRKGRERGSERGSNKGKGETEEPRRIEKSE